MRREYGPLLEIGEDLARYQGYLSPNEEKECAKLEGAFASERRKLVYDLIKSGEPPAVLLTTVNADLERLEATGNYSGFTIGHVREELTKHIAKQAGSSPIIRFATRWGPPVLGILAMAVYFWLQTMRR